MAREQATLPALGSLVAFQFGVASHQKLYPGIGRTGVGLHITLGQR